VAKNWNRIGVSSFGRKCLELKSSVNEAEEQTYRSTLFAESTEKISSSDMLENG
jgi:hypothetical protein